MKNTEIVGHQQILGFLSGAIENDKVSHAYLFVGVHQVGKEDVARWFAQKLVAAISQTSRNIIFIRPKDGLKILDVRTVQHEMNLTNPLGGRRVVIMGDVDKMRVDGQNAFLKMLEEPQTDVVFILLASRLGGVLPTIVSRTQLVRFSLVNRKEIRNYLTATEISKSRADELVRLSRGRPGWVKKQLATGEELSDFEKDAGDFLQLISQSIPARFKYIREITKPDATVPISSWEGALRDLLLWQNGKTDDVILVSLRDKLEQAALHLEPKTVIQALRGLQELRQNFDKNLNAKVVLENYFISYIPS